MHFTLENEKQTNQFDVLKNLRLEVGDLSGLTLLQGQEERLLVLSDDSHSLHVIDLAGQEISRIRLGLIYLSYPPLLKAIFVSDKAESTPCSLPT